MSDLMFRELSAEDYERLLQLDEQAGVNTKGATQSAIHRLPVSVYTSVAKAGEAPASCCICMEDLVTGDAVKWLPCTHVFHADCIDPWLAVNSTCPTDMKPLQL